MEPLAVGFPDAEKISGLGRSMLYALAKQGRIELIKVGNRSLITYASLKALVGGTRG